LADLQRTVYPHSGQPPAAGRAQDRVSSLAKDQRSANCAATVRGLVAKEVDCSRLRGRTHHFVLSTLLLCPLRLLRLLCVVVVVVDDDVK